MDIFKRFARGFSSQIFKLSLFFMATMAALVLVLGTPGTIKTAFKDSGIYDKFLKTVLDESSKENSGDDLPLQDPGVRTAVEKAIPSQTFQTIVDGFLDGTYGWLQGKTATPQVKVDVSSIKQNVANSLGDYAVSRAQSLPPCTPQQARALQVNGVDPLKVTCVPSGFDVSSLKQRVIDDVNKNNDIIKDTTITADSLTVDKEQGFSLEPVQSVPFYKQNQISKAPQIFQWLVRLPWLLGSLAILSGAALLFLHEERRRGLHVISRTVLGVGVILVASVLLVTYLASQVHPAVDNQNDLAAVVPVIIKNLANKLNRVLLQFGAAYILLGGGGLLALYVTRQKLPKAEPTSAPSSVPPVEGSQLETSTETKEETAEKSKIQ